MYKDWDKVTISIIIVTSLLSPIAGQMDYSDSGELTSYFGDFLNTDTDQVSFHYSGTSHLPGTSYQGISKQGGNYQDKGQTPAPGYYGQRAVSSSIQNTGSSPNEFRAIIPYIQSESGQVRSDGKISSYPNVGTSGDVSSQAFLSFDVSSIPAGSTIHDVSLEFQGCDMVGTPFTKLGCLNAYPISYSMLSMQSYYLGRGSSSPLRVCSSGELNMPRSCPELIGALQACVGSPRFQLRFQFDRSNAGRVTSGGTVMTRRKEPRGGESNYIPGAVSPGVVSEPFTSETMYAINDGYSADVGYSVESLDFSHGQYYVLTPGVNLSELGITQEMLEKAIDPGSVKVAHDYMYYEKASVKTPPIPSEPVPWLDSEIPSEQPIITNFGTQPIIEEENFFKIGAIWIDIAYTLPQQAPLQENPPDLGVSWFSQPEPSNLIDASSVGWGEVPANQVLIEIDNTLSFEEARIVAQQLASVLRGQVAGEFQYINLFQIETQSKSLNELIRDIESARNQPSIVLAFPNQQVYRESSPLVDSIYQGKSGTGFNIIGVQEAWDYIGRSQIDLSEVHVGVTDDGIYKGYGEFNETDINTSIKIYIGAPSSQLTSPLKGFETAGSHGTGVMNILAADPDDGGLVGIASEPLGENLKVDMVNIFDQNRSFITTSLLGLKYEIENGCTIFSISWGNSKADEHAVKMYENWFKKLSEDYPRLLFICSAGNDGMPVVVTRRFPNGLPDNQGSLPNIITVGNIFNNGSMCKLSNRNQDNNYVTLAAPGEQAVWGRNSSGNIINFGGGTSMATPHITAAAALIRSIDPTLTAAQIKAILSETGYDNVSGVEAPADLGGHILAIGRAAKRAGAQRPEQPEVSADKPKNIELPEGYDKEGQGFTETASLDFGTVKGKVYNRNNGAGVASAEMTYRKWPGGEEIMTGVMTDSNGNYQFRLPPGQYQINAKVSGYGIIPWVVDVNPGQISERDLKAVKGV